METDRMHQVAALGAMGLAVLLALAEQAGSPATAVGASSAWAEEVESGADHLTTRELADRLLAGMPPLLVDVRPAEEYASFHLPGAVRMSLPELLGPQGEALRRSAGERDVVLYSNGPAHPAQAWVELRRRGVVGVRVLDGGLDQFVTDELTPPSLREAASAASVAAAHERFAALHRLVLGRPLAATAGTPPAVQQQGGPARHATDPVELERPTFVSTAWLAGNLGRVRVVDTRGKVEDFAKGHIAGAVHAPIELVRTTRDGVGDELLLVPELAARLGALGIDAEAAVVAYGDRLQDPAHFALALLRLGHRRVAILEGGLQAWVHEGRALSTEAATVEARTYVPRSVEDFTASLADVRRASETATAAILDTRPADQFGGKESTEARGGHIPGAKNRPIAEDVVTDESGVFLRARPQLQEAYTALGVAPADPVIVSCRTGHQAAQTWFVLRYVLGYENVRWYDGSWKEWAAHRELPAATK